MTRPSWNQVGKKQGFKIAGPICDTFNGVLELQLDVLPMGGNLI